MFKVVITGVSIILLLCAQGCPKSVASRIGSSNCNLPLEVKESKGATVATIGDEVFTDAGLKERINSRPTYVRNRINSPAGLKGFLEGEIQTELLVKEAISRGYLSSDDVVQQIKRVLAQKMSKEEFSNKAPVKVPDEEIKAYYTNNPKEFNTEERFRALFAYLPFGDDKVKSLKLMKTVREMAMKSVKNKTEKNGLTVSSIFAKYAKTPEHSGAEDTGLLVASEMKDRFGEKLQAALWSMADTNEVSHVIETDVGYYVLAKTDHRPASTRDFESSKDNIARKLTQERTRADFTKFVDGLKSKYKVAIFEDRLAKVELVASADTNNAMKDKTVQ